MCWALIFVGVAAILGLLRLGYVFWRWAVRGW